jgi:hypothetical protein
MKRLATILGIVALLLVSSSHAQQRWERNYGGAGEELGYSVQQTSGGGYIVGGYTESFGNGRQIYLIKTNASGDTLWTRTYGGTGYDEGYSVQQTSEGGYIISGCTNSFGNGTQVYLIKTNSTGDTLWTKTYGGPTYDVGYSVRQTSDGGYIIVGVTMPVGDTLGDVYLIKTSPSGDTLWTKTYGGDYGDAGYSVQQTSDGGYIVGGCYYSSWFGNLAYLIKTNMNGDTLWSRTYGAGYEDGRSVQQTTDGGYIMAGSTYPRGASWQVYLIKTDSAGETLWIKDYGGTSYDFGNSVQQTTDAGFIIAGWCSYLGGNAVYLVKTNASGDTLWTKAFEGTRGELGNYVQQTSDGGYIIAGETQSYGNGIQVYLIKTDANGSSGVEETVEVRGQSLEVRLTATPNPFTSFATLPGHEAERFSLYDISGRKVGTYQGGRVGEGLAPGVYFLRSSDGQDKPLRIVKVR